MNNILDLDGQIRIVIFKREVAIWIRGGQVQLSLKRDMIDKAVAFYLKFKKQEA